jgi:hypothetical protein
LSSLYQGGVTDNAPYGFLRRVEAVEKTRSGVIVTTINAAMTHNSFDIKKGFMILVGLSKRLHYLFLIYCSLFANSRTSSSKFAALL